MFSQLRSWLILFALLVVFFVGPGCSPDPPNVIVVPGVEPDPSPDGGKQKQVIAAETFVESFEADPLEHAKKYTGVRIELSGRVRRVGVLEDRSSSMIRLEAVADSPQFDVICKTQTAKPWEKVLPGQTVRIRGVGANHLAAPILERCEILEVKGSRPPVYAAEAIAREFVADFDAATRRHRDRSIVLEGVVTALETDPVGAEVFLMTDPDGPELFVGLALLDEQRGQLKVGELVRVLAGYSPDLSDENQLFFATGTLLE